MCMKIWNGIHAWKVNPSVPSDFQLQMDRGKSSDFFCLPVSRLSILLEMKLQNRDLAKQTNRRQPSCEYKAEPN